MIAVAGPSLESVTGPGQDLQHESPLPGQSRFWDTVDDDVEDLASVLAVADDPVVVEADLAAGRLRCPRCHGPLGPWSWAREREVRRLGARQRIRPRRSRCRDCRATHVLVPVSTLARRRDASAVIGAALWARHGGAGHRRIAADLGLPEATVRGWLRRFAERAGQVRAVAAAWLHRLDPLHPGIQARGSPPHDALEAIGLVVAAARRRWGPGAPPWHVIAGLTGGALLSTGTLSMP